MFDFFQDMPNELVVKIISNFNKNERARLAIINQKFRCANAKIIELNKALEHVIVCMIYNSDENDIDVLAKRMDGYLSSGADPNMISYIQNRPILVYLAQDGSSNSKGSLIAAELLIKFGAQINIQTPTPLYLAALYGNARMAKLLIDHGATGMHENELKGDVNDYPDILNAILTNQNWEAAYQQEINEGSKYRSNRSFCENTRCDL